MGLRLLAGPANAGKVAALLERYVAALEREPVLIVPNRADVERVERELVRRAPALFGGFIGTFDDLFERIVRAGDPVPPVATSLQRTLLLRRAVAATSLNGLAASARFGGFVDALGEAIAELEGALLDPRDVDGALGELFRAYRAELDRVGLWDVDLLRGHAAERVGSELGAWSGEPVFAYGFEDLTAAQWRLLEALAGRAEVTVSLPYEPGRPAFASLERTAEDLAALARGDVEWLAPRASEHAHPALAHLERALFAEAAPPAAPPIEGAVVWLEGAGTRGALELVGDEIASLLRGGTPAGEIAVVCPSLDRWRKPLETVFATLGIPYSVDGRVRLAQTPFGHALLALLRFAWDEPRRRDLYAFLRSPYSGLTRAHVDFLEGRLRGRAIQAERVEEETVKLRGAPLPALDALRSATPPLAAVGELAAAMLRNAYGLEANAVGESSKLDLRAHDSVVRLLAELAGWEEVGGPVTREELVTALDRADVRLAAGEDGRVAVLDLMRARTRRVDVLFVLGLEEGSLPRRAPASPFLADDERRRRPEARLVKPDAVARDRYLFYTACTRPARRLFLVREATTDDGGPRQASPFWEETRAVFPPDDVARWTRRRPLSGLTWPLDAAPSERERLRALAVLAPVEPDLATALALSNGWERRLERALAAFERPTRLTHPAVLEELQTRSSFSVTDLERFADCSSIWLIERVISPRSIDAEVDAMLRGQVAHAALHKFFAGLPKRLGAERVDTANVEEALGFMRECLDEALAGGVRLDLSDLDRLELEGGLWRDLEGFVRAEAETAWPLVPRRFEVAFGTDRAAPELQRGLDLGGFTVSGKIDRIDVDPFSARGIVQDYKSGKSAHSARRIEEELLLQIPLYMLVLRDLVGIEPLGGVYRALGGKREARGILRADAEADGVPGFKRNDYLAEEQFWGQVSLAQERARAIVGRIRAGDVRHDPKGGECPEWCELWSMCRIRRA